MKYIPLTKREDQAITFLWKHNKEISTNDISIYTIKQVLKYLESIE